MKNITIHNKSTVNAHGTHTGATTKSVVCKTDRLIFISGMDAAEYYEVGNDSISRNCNHKQSCVKTKHGIKTFCFLSEILENLDELLTPVVHTDEEYDALKAVLEEAQKQNEILKAQVEELKEDAALGRAIREEHEKEEERQRAIAEMESVIEQRKRICEQREAEAQRAVAELMEAESKLAELKGE